MRQLFRAVRPTCLFVLLEAYLRYSSEEPILSISMMCVLELLTAAW